MPLELNPGLDAEALRNQFAREKRIHIPSILTQASALTAVAALERHQPWNIVAFVNGKHHDFDAAALRLEPRAKVQNMIDLAHREARRGFGYIYGNFPIYDVWRSRGMVTPQLDPVVAFLNGAPFLEFARQLTGAADIGFADFQATKYERNHFLTKHNDFSSTHNRRAAYVLNLTPRWKADWGGQLLFHDERGHVTAGYMPAFNALNVFMVPMDHSVAAVAPFADAARYAITGWLRAGKDETPIAP